MWQIWPKQPNFSVKSGRESFNKDVNIRWWNVNGRLSSINKAFMRDMDIVFLSETHANVNILEKVNGFTIFVDLNIPIPIYHGGLAVYVKDHLAQYVTNICYGKCSISFDLNIIPNTCFLSNRFFEFWYHWLWSFKKWCLAFRCLHPFNRWQHNYERNSWVILSNEKRLIWFQCIYIISYVSLYSAYNPTSTQYNVFQRFPWKLCTALLSVIPKPGSLLLPKNYRGISMQAIVANLYDRIISNRLMKWVKINPEQTAFQKGKWTVGQIFLLRLIIGLIKDNKMTLYICIYIYIYTLYIGFLDLSKAFDKVSRFLLLKTLVGYR